MPRALPPPAPPGRLALIAEVAPAVHAVLEDRLGVSPALIAPHVALGGDLAIDSLDLLEAVLDLESVFRIHVPEREIDRVQTVADLVHVVARYLWERDHPEPVAARRSEREAA